MRRRAEREAVEQPSTNESEVLHPLNHQEMNEKPPEVVTLGIGSRSSLVENGHGLVMLLRPRGLLPVPPEVVAEVERQEAKHAMTPEYRKTLCDRLTLEHYFSDVEVAFRRTPEGIEVLAAGLDEIAEFRGITMREQRQGVVYGVG